MSQDPLVYVVDDDDAVRDMISWLMDSVKLPTELFSSARAFLDKFGPGKIACLLLDVRMPEMSGIELQRELKKLDPALPIIIITGHADVPMAVHAMREGAFDFIEKPFNNQLLLDRVQAAVNKSRLVHEEKAEVLELEALIDGLTSREKEVLDLVVSGETNKGIAHKLDITIKTVEVHRGNMMRKMQANSIADLMSKVNAR
ncbi:MAG: response regulator [Alphaproteobacteria bacterium]|nr:response regulator [Rhodospirillales bacterium]MCW9044997.1 response regulator [Alphaproteobacteria bacterium]